MKSEGKIDKYVPLTSSAAVEIMDLMLSAEKTEAGVEGETEVLPLPLAGDKLVFESSIDSVDLPILLELLDPHWFHLFRPQLNTRPHSVRATVSPAEQCTDLKTGVVASVEVETIASMRTGYGKYLPRERRRKESVMHKSLFKIIQALTLLQYYQTVCCLM